LGHIGCDATSSSPAGIILRSPRLSPALLTGLGRCRVEAKKENVGSQFLSLRQCPGQILPKTNLLAIRINVFKEWITAQNSITALR